MTPIAVIIPTLDEAEELPATLEALTADPPAPLEIVVADGGSRDDTTARARALGARVVSGARGRAAQMNLGARATTGDPLLFLHADTRLDRGHLAALLAALRDPGVAGGSFPIRLDASGVFYRVTEAAANLRTRFDGSPYGDQAIFCRRAAFEAAGGYPAIAIMEDVAFARRLGQTGRMVFLAGPRVQTSARRWRENGRLRTLWVNFSTRLLFEAGVAPDRLRRRYDCRSRERN